MNDKAQSPPSRETALLNRDYFREQHGAAFVEGSPHLKHAGLRRLCGEMAAEVFHRVPMTDEPVNVLDMGAGDGMLTLPYLEMGASVIAADASDDLLADLKQKAARFQSSLKVMTGDIFAALEQLSLANRRFDIVCASSFLHHIPDYVELCRRALPLLAPRGILFTLQDPLRYDTLSRPTYLFDRISYFGWRLLQGNYIGGFKTRIRRLFNIYRDDLAADTAEYHVVRNGVDHLALRDLLQGAGMNCEVRPYWSTQSALFQNLGERMSLKNTFAVIAQKRA